MVATRRQRKLNEGVAPEAAGLPPPQPGQQKRKSVTLEPAPEAASPKRPRHNTTTRCRFLELPRELRDEIYKHVLASEGSAVTMRQRSFITKSSLVSTSTQIREEYLDAVLFYSPVINTTVRNHNFAHVVTFLNRLSEAQLSRFKSDAARAGQRNIARTIRITLTYSNTKQSTRQQLNRWLDRFDDPMRRGAEIEFQYVLDYASWGDGGYKQRPQTRKTAGPRSSEETNKICRAIYRNRYRV